MRWCGPAQRAHARQQWANPWISWTGYVVHTAIGYAGGSTCYLIGSYLLLVEVGSPNSLSG